MSYPSPDRRRFDDDFDKNFKRMAGAMMVWWVICAVLGIALTVTLIWGIVQVVQALT